MLFPMQHLNSNNNKESDIALIKLKEAAKSASDHVKLQAESWAAQYSVKN